MQPSLRHGASAAQSAFCAAKRFLAGQFTRANLIHSLWLGPLALVSTWAGVHVVRRIDPARFYGLIYWLMILVGVKLVWDGLR